MKKLGVVRWWGIGAAGLGVVAAGVLTIVPRMEASSSRVVLSDGIEENRRILHDADGHHACHCFSPMISYFRIDNITATSARFTWDCSEASTYQVNYGLTSAKGTYFPATTPTATYNEHSVTVTGLTPNTLYHAGPSSICLRNCTNNASPNLRKEWLMDDKSRSNWTFRTLEATAVRDAATPAAAPAALAVSDVAVAKVTTKSVSIRWKTNAPATSMVEYGLTADYGMKSGVNTEMVTDHHIQLFDLQPATTYHFRTVSYSSNPSGSALSKNMSFTTPAIDERIVKTEHIFNEPNPCSDWTIFAYFCYQPMKRVTIDVMTLSGKCIANLVSPASALAEGWNKVRWDLRDNDGNLLKNGLYVYKMKFQSIDNREVEVRSASLRVAR